MSRKVLLAQYSSQPIFVNNHDPLFDLLSGSRIRHSAGKREKYTQPITFYVADDIARHIQQNAKQIAARIFRFHKNQMFWFAVSQVRALGKGHGRPAIQDWLNLFGVDEDDYSIDAAYKSFQRFGWNFAEKNSTFSGQLRRKTAYKLSRKTRVCAKKRTPLQELNWNMEDIQVELRIARFITGYANCFQRIPVKMHKHAKVYLYIKLQELSVRDAEQKLQISRNGVHHAMKAMKARIDKNPAIAELMREVADLPVPA